ncbi:MAG TPA: ATP-binding cassette domain-containing protein, partial [Nitrococcus sp.]|nr:ATP-binding cassette domain-containing protein [Nitrococcus sp.]
MIEQGQPLVEVQGLCKQLGGHWIHKDLNLTLFEGEILAVVGSSGSGKTMLLWQIIGLLQPDAGTIRVFGEDLSKIDVDAARALRSRWGVLFQEGALFSALTVFENIAFPLRELSIIGIRLREDFIFNLVMLKLDVVGLNTADAWKLPAELSGGMVKRVALARALALDAEILFLDEPTAGLDPNSAAEFDHLIKQLHADLGLSCLMITHDLNSLFTVSDRVAVLDEGR